MALMAQSFARDSWCTPAAERSARLLAAGDFFLGRDQVVPLAVDPGQAALEQSEAPVVCLVPHQYLAQIAQLLQPLGGLPGCGRRTEIQLGMEGAP